MKFRPLVFPVLSLAAFATVLLLEHSVPPAARAASMDDEWVNMSEGADLKANKYWFTEGNWTLKDGVFSLKPRPGETGWKRWKSYLWSKKMNYGDFEIKFDYKVEKDSNSGFFFRVEEKNMFVEAAKYGLEVQIIDSFGAKGKLNDHISGGLIPGVPPLKNAAKPITEWNTMHIINKDDKLTVILNDEKVQNQFDMTKGAIGQRPKIGPIGFQDEALPVSYRNVRLLELKKK